MKRKQNHAVACQKFYMWFRNQHLNTPLVYQLFANMNEGQRTNGAGAVSQGLLKGVPDYTCDINGCFYIEVKVDKDSLSKYQKAFIENNP